MKTFVNGKEISEQTTDRFSKHTPEGYADINSDDLIHVEGNKAVFTKNVGKCTKELCRT